MELKIIPSSVTIFSSTCTAEVHGHNMSELPRIKRNNLCVIITAVTYSQDKYDNIPRTFFYST